MDQLKKFRAALALLVLAAVAVLAVGCGGGDGDGGADSQANATDEAFVRLMVPHHTSAVDMAKLAQENGEHPEVKKLADSIVETQTAEIDELERIGKSIGATEDSAMSGMEHGGGSMENTDLGTLRLTPDGAGMSMDMEGLEQAKEFDREFIDMMIEHHTGAIAMAKAELARGANPELKAIAGDIVSAQEKEIKEMRAWRADWYGSSSAS